MDLTSITEEFRRLCRIGAKAQLIQFIHNGGEWRESENIFRPHSRQINFATKFYVALIVTMTWAMLSLTINHSLNIKMDVQEAKVRGGKRYSLVKPMKMAVFRRIKKPITVKNKTLPILMYPNALAVPRPTFRRRAVIPVDESGKIHRCAVNGKSNQQIQFLRHSSFYSLMDQRMLEVLDLHKNLTTEPPESLKDVEHLVRTFRGFDGFLHNVKVSIPIRGTPEAWTFAVDFVVVANIKRCIDYVSTDDYYHLINQYNTLGKKIHSKQPSPPKRSTEEGDSFMPNSDTQSKSESNPILDKGIIPRGTTGIVLEQEILSIFGCQVLYGESGDEIYIRPRPKPVNKPACVRHYFNAKIKLDNDEIADVCVYIKNGPVAQISKELNKRLTKYRQLIPKLPIKLRTFAPFSNVCFELPFSKITTYAKTMESNEDITLDIVFLQTADILIDYENNFLFIPDDDVFRRIRLHEDHEPLHQRANPNLDWHV